MKKKIITWKDADQNLCKLAASMLHQANQALRSSYPTEEVYRDTAGGLITGGIGEPSGSKRTWWSGGGPKPPTSAVAGLKGLPPLCWWSFQNIIRRRLKQARRELYQALYAQSKAPRVSKQKTRNPNGRKRGSKYGWRAS